MNELFVGIDAGGTKTELLAEAQGDSLRLADRGVNAARDGAEAVARVLAGLTLDALDRAGGATLGALVAGVAGAGREAEQQAVAAHVARLLGVPDERVVVVHDAAIALEAALGEESGLVVVAGTGSVLFARARAGGTHRAGGWGGPLGDDGSGMALGRGALRAALAALDGGPPTLLTERLADTHGVRTADDLLALVYGPDAPTFSSLAPLVLAAADAGDWAASALLLRETNALAQQAAWLTARAEADGGDIERRAALLGGLVAETTYREALLAALGRFLPGWTAAPSARRPVEGALRMALRRPVADAYTSDSGG